MGSPHPHGLLCYRSEAALTPRRQNSSWASLGPHRCHQGSLSGCLGPLPPPGQDGRLMDRPPHSAPALPQCSARAALPGGLLDKHGLKAPHGHTGPVWVTAGLCCRPQAPSLTGWRCRRAAPPVLLGLKPSFHSPRLLREGSDTWSTRGHRAPGPQCAGRHAPWKPQATAGGRQVHVSDSALRDPG